MTLRGRRRQGQKFSERFCIMISRDLRNALERRAMETDRSLGEVARKALSEKLLPMVEETA